MEKFHQYIMMIFTEISFHPCIYWKTSINVFFGVNQEND